jgi:hypothetical protein
VDLRPNVFIVLMTPTSLPESRWVHHVPRVGSHIRDSAGTSWKVADVLQSGMNVYTVVCEPARARDVRRLAGDLLDRARRTTSSTERRLRRHLP